MNDEAAVNKVPIIFVVPSVVDYLIRLQPLAGFPLKISWLVGLHKTAAYNLFVIL